MLPRRSSRSAALLATAALLLSCDAARAARLGVPAGAGVDPNGYFILVSSDAVNQTVAAALGDVAHFLTFAIENDQQGLHVDLYDPGLFDPSLGPNQLDANLGRPPVTPAGIRYRLFGPDGTGALDALLVERTFLADTAATDRALVTLFDDRRAPRGLYHLVVTMLDGPNEEQDVGVFGVSVPGRNVSALGLTLGRSDDSGASITEPVATFPWVVSPSAGSDAFGPVCGLQFVTYDLDAALNGDMPPTAAITARGGFAFPPDGSSGDARWWETDLGGINPGDLDSSDHGPWRWDFSDLDMPEDCFGNLSAPIRLNAFGIQVLDYGAPARDFTSWADLPDSPPFFVFNPDGPRRIYLPYDAGGPPVKETLNQRATITSGYPAITLGETSSVEVVLTLDNPTAYALGNVQGSTHVAPSADLTDPVFVSATGGLTATINAGDARRIDFQGAVAAGARAEITYRLDVTPSALGIGFLTGDGTSYAGTSRATSCTYETPFTDPTSLILPVEAQGPICQLSYDAVAPTCAARADLVPSATRTCAGTTVTLDASTSEVFSCPGGVPVFQWSVNGSVSRPFPAAATIDVVPILNDTWEVTVACSTDPTNCNDTATMTFDLYPAPIVDVGADQVACSGNAVVITSAVSGGSPPYSNYRWTTLPPGEPGDGATTPSLNVTPTQDTTYALSVDDGQGCTGTDSVVVDVRSPDPAIVPDPPLLCGGGSVDISAAAGFASYAWSTSPRGEPGDGATTPTVTASSGGVTYTVVVTDDAGCTGTQSVTTQASADPTPPAMNWSLRLSKEGNDLRYSWQDLPDPAGGYELLWFDCTDANGDRICDSPPTAAAMAASSSNVTVAAGAQTHVEPNGVNRSPKLIFSKVRALSPCSLTPGLFGD